MAADYANLDNSVKTLKMHAVDAYVRKFMRSHLIGDEAFQMGEFKIHDDHYEVILSACTIYISRPNGDVGGGQVHAEPFMHNMGIEDRYNFILEHDFVTDFNDVRNRIEELIAPWRDLPQPSTIKNLYESNFQSISKALAIPGASVGVESPTGESKIYGDLNLVKDASDAMSGTSWDAFRSRFYELLPPAINANNGLAHYLASTIEAERALFEQACLHIAETVDNASRAFDVAAQTQLAASDFDWWGLVLNIGIIVADAALAVVSGGTLTPVIAASGVVAGLKIVEAVTGKLEKTDPVPPRYDEILHRFANDLADIRRQVYVAEREIANNLSYNDGQARKNAGHYDLKLSEIATGSAQELSIKDRDKVQTIYRTVMPEIGNELAHTASKIVNLSVAFARAVVRHDGIGIGRLGPLAQFQNFAATIARYLLELSEEASLGGRNLEAAVNDIDLQDEDSQSTLDSVLKDIETYTAKND